jgi:hypothetical protein
MGEQDPRSDGTAAKPEEAQMERAGPTQTSPEALPPRTRRRSQWLRSVVTGALALLLMTGSAWVGYRVLFALAGAPATVPQPTFDPDPTGFASLYDLRLTAVDDGVIITWSAQNLGDRSWFPSTHHWKPLSDDLPPIPILGEIGPGETAHVAVRLTRTHPARIGWQLVGLKGAVKDGKLQVEITPEGERK